MNIKKKVVSGIILGVLFFGYFHLSFAQGNINNISQEDLSKVEKEILSVQQDIFNTSKKSLEDMFGALQKNLSYQENGNIGLAIEANIPYTGSGNLKVNFKNYTALTNMLNSQIDGNLGISLDIESPFFVQGEKVELDVSGDISLIDISGENFLRIKNITGNGNIPEFQEYIELAQEIFKQEKYIRLGKKGSGEALIEALENFDFNNLLQKGEDAFSQPLLTPIKKSGNTYTLIPSRYACEKYFELSQSFLSGFISECNDTVYQTFTKTFSKEHDITFSLMGKNKILSYKYTKDRQIINVRITYDDEGIKKINLLIKDNEGTFNASFEENKLLDISLKAPGENVAFDFKSLLDKNNRFTQIESFLKSKNINGEIRLKNNKLHGVFVGKKYGYSFAQSDTFGNGNGNGNGDIFGRQKFEQKLTDMYAFQITGNTDKQNKFQNGKFLFAQVDVSTKQLNTGVKISYQGNNFDIHIKDFSNKESPFLLGKGKIDKKYFDFNGKLYETKEKLLGELHILVDGRDDKVNLDFKVQSYRDEYIFLEIYSQGKRTYKNVEIKQPKDFIKIEDIEDIF